MLASKLFFVKCVLLVLADPQCQQCYVGSLGVAVRLVDCCSEVNKF